MTRNRLSSTTAMVLSLSLAAPMPLAAQTAPECDAQMQFPCTVPGLGVTVQNQQEFDAIAQSGGNNESQTGPVTAPAAPEAEVGAEAQTEVQTEAETPPTEETAPAEAAAPEAQADAPETEAEVAPETPPVQAESQENAAPAADPAPEAQQAAPVEPETAEEAPVAEEAPEAAPAPETAQPDPAQSESMENQVPETATGAGAETDTQAETATETTEPETDAPEATGTAETDAQTGTDTQADTPAQTTDADAPRSESLENQVPQVVDPEAQAEAAARAEEATSAAAAATEDAEVVDTTETTVTEAEARSSGEEFSTTAAGQPAAQAAAPAQSSDDKGDDVLKLLGTAAVAGLGAYAIGRVLDGGGKVVSNTGDRVIVEENGQYRVLKDDDTLLRRPGSDVRTQTYSDGSTRTVVTAPDGTETITIRAANGRVLSRTRVLEDGRRVVLFDDTQDYERVDVSQLRPARSQDYDYSTSDVDELRAALASSSGELPDRSFSLNQIRQIDAVRKLVPVIALDAINFQTGSAVIRPEEADALQALGNAMRDAIRQDPDQVFLIEGHTDTVGAASYNLALSDRRAESVALALAEYFDVPPSNMIVQGYGEADLKIREAGDIRANRRAAVRNITPLLRGAGG